MNRSFHRFVGNSGIKMGHIFAKLALSNPHQLNLAPLNLLISRSALQMSQVFTALY
jgi:hypothetical protein